MSNPTDADRRLAILRRNETWRTSSQALTIVAAFAVIALVVLPVNGVDLTLVTIATLLATAVVTISLAFLVLRFIDYSA